MSEHFLLFQGVRILVLIHCYWVKGWIGLLHWPAGKVGDVWFLCLCRPLQPSTFLKDRTKPPVQGHQSGFTVFLGDET